MKKIPNPLPLNENELILMAMRELKGRPPPGFEHYDGYDEQSLSEPVAPAKGAQKTAIARELEARGWTPLDLSRASGFSRSESLALIRGTMRMSHEIALVLGKVFATSSDYWMRGGE